MNTPQIKNNGSPVRVDVQNGIATAAGETRESSRAKVDHKEGGDCLAASVCLNSGQLMDRALAALEKREPLSIISVGQTEAFVMAQYSLYTEQEFMRHREAYNANRGEMSGFMHRGIRFPNLPARDEAVQAARQADIVGFNTIEKNARRLTEQVFDYFSITPPFYFEANIRRVFMYSQREKFETMLAGRKVLLISSIAPQAGKSLEEELQEKLRFEVAGTIPIWEYGEIPAVKEALTKYEFDLCFLAAGVNATILAPYIARTYGKVAFDIGWGMKSFITGSVVTDSFITEVIGMENLFKL